MCTTAVIVLALVVVYQLYQIARGEAVWRMLLKWKAANDTRWRTYTYDELYDTVRRTWYGFRWPDERNYSKIVVP